MHIHTQISLIAFLMIGISGCGASRPVLVKCIVENNRFIVLTENEEDNIDLIIQNKESNSYISELPIVGGGTHAFVNGLLLESNTLKLDNQEYILTSDDNGKYLLWSR
jgi:hypothetical protein